MFVLILQRLLVLKETPGNCNISHSLIINSAALGDAVCLKMEFVVILEDAVLKAGFATKETVTQIINKNF